MAAGIADNYVLNQLAESIGLGAHIVVPPFVNQGLAANPVFLRSADELRQAGARVLFGPQSSNHTRRAPALKCSTVTHGIGHLRPPRNNARLKQSTGSPTVDTSRIGTPRRPPSG
jgi:hypothetical protein